MKATYQDFWTGLDQMADLQSSPQPSSLSPSLEKTGLKSESEYYKSALSA